MVTARLFAAACVFSFACGGGVTFARASDDEDGEKLPFYASTRSDKVNVRTGPNVRYPIRWVYKRKYWPVKVTSEFEHWYKISDALGDVGWVHKTLVTGKRYVVVAGEAPAPAYDNPEAEKRPAFLMEPGVVAKLEEEGCAGDWCAVDADGYRGWTSASALWGAR
ncbi:MAG: SH3 domain-containing protein [Rickettsiales bacterium]